MLWSKVFGVGGLVVLVVFGFMNSIFDLYNALYFRSCPLMRV